MRLLQGLARFHLRRSRARIVAIAGGRGKTVLKRTLVELLGAELRVRGNPLSYNTDVGVAFAVLETRFDTRSKTSIAAGMARAVWNALFLPRADVLVLELGVRAPGDMRDLLRVVQPHLAVVTELVPSYSEDHSGLAAMRQEMKELIDFLHQKGGTVAVCGDDSALVELAGPAGAHLFGRDALVQQNGGWSLRVEGRTYPLTREVVGDGNLYALAASVLVAQHLGLGEARIRQFLAPGLGSSQIS